MSVHSDIKLFKELRDIRVDNEFMG